MKKIITFIIAAAMLLSCTAIANAEVSLPEDYEFYSIDGMQRVFATSSYAPDFKTDTAPAFDHRTGTGCTFDLTDIKTVTIHICSRDCETVEKFAWIVDCESVKVSFAATNDPDLTDWTYFDFETETDGKWTVASVKDIKEGYAFYRIDIEAADSESVTVTELALFRTAESAKTPAQSGTLLEREMWRLAQKFRGKGFFAR